MTLFRKEIGTCKMEVWAATLKSDRKTPKNYKIRSLKLIKIRFPNHELPATDDNERWLKCRYYQHWGHLSSCYGIVSRYVG
jgi:hypothetical protein